MMKKIVSLLCLVSMLSAFVPGNCIFAEGAGTTTAKASVLQALGIDGGNANGSVTNDYILTALEGFLYGDDEKPSAEEFARTLGITEYGEVYDGSASVTRNDAITYALTVLGYKAYAEAMGEDGIKTVASSLGVSKGLSMINDDPITKDECVIILYNMLEVEPMSAVYSESQVKHIIEADQTLLSKYRDIHKIKGILTADGITSLDSENACTDGYIKIDSSLYAVENNILEENLLGKNVEAYIEETDDDTNALYIYENAGRNTELVIDAKDVNTVNADYSVLEYYADNKLKKAKIDAVPRVIFNGVFYGDYEVTDFKPEAGNVRLLDNDGDSKYDVIFINSYETVVVDAVDANRKIIHNKFKTSGHIASINLDTETVEVKYTISDTVQKLELTDIKEKDILLVAKSKSAGNVVYEILVSNESFTGKLQSINTNYMELLIDDFDYTIVDSFLKYMDEEENLKLGNTYKFFVDALGNVAYWEKVTEDGYAIVQKIYRDWENEILYVSYMNLDGKWIDAPIAKKFTFGGTFYSRLEMETAYEILKDVSGIVKVTFNADDEVKVIETPTETTTSNKNVFTKTPDTSLRYRSSSRGFTDDNNSNKYKYYLEDDAKIIILPTDLRDRYGYEVREASGYFGSDVSYAGLSFCDFDEYGFSSLVIKQYSTMLKNTLFVVTGTTTILDQGEVRSQIAGYAGEFKNFTLTGVDASTFSGVEKGDIIKVSVNTEGYADGYSLVFKLPNMQNNDGSQYLGGTQYDGQPNMAGEVEAVAAGKNRLRVNINGTSYTYKLNNSATVQIYSPTEGLKTASTHDIMCGDRVFIHLSWGNVQQIIIHE